MLLQRHKPSKRPLSCAWARREPSFPPRLHACTYFDKAFRPPLFFLNENVSSKWHSPLPASLRPVREFVSSARQTEEQKALPLLLKHPSSLSPPPPLSFSISCFSIFLSVISLFLHGRSSKHIRKLNNCLAGPVISLFLSLSHSLFLASSPQSWELRRLPFTRSPWNFPWVYSDVSSVDH